jgi:hypothetical protein
MTDLYKPVKVYVSLGTSEDCTSSTSDKGIAYHFPVAEIRQEDANNEAAGKLLYKLLNELTAEEGDLLELLDKLSITKQ